LSEYPTLSEEKVLFEHGHTLSLIKIKDEFLGYLGHIDFSKIEIFRGKDIYNMEKVGEIPNVRWGSTIRIYNGEIIRLYFTKQDLLSKLPFVNPCRSQTIYFMGGVSGLFNKGPLYRQKVERASAPFAFRDKTGRLALACHKRDPHQILVFMPEGPLEILNFGKQIVSAPSIAYFRDQYWLTCEYRITHGNWRTMLYSGTQLNSLKLVSINFLLNTACAFQHLFGERYVLTYSKQTKEGWKLCAREGKL